MAVLLRDRFLRSLSVAGLLIAALVVSSGCQGGPMVRGQSPEVTAPPRLRSTAQPVPGRTIDSAPSPSEPRSADGLLVTSVQIEGNEAITVSAIRHLLRIQPGRTVTDSQVREDVRRLFATRWFFSVEPLFRPDLKNPGGRLLVFRVVERPMIHAIRYEGNKRIDDDDLAEATGLRTGSPFDISANREAVRRIQKIYQEKGFPFAKITLASGGRRADRDVVFRIEEGQKIVVAAVTFLGNNYRYATPGILKTKLTTKRALFGFDLFGGKFDPKTIHQDKLGLASYYRGMGFFDIKVTHRVLTGDVVYNPFRRGDANLTIEYTIEEGRQHSIRTVTLRGNKVFSTEQLEANLKLISGETFNQRHLAADVRQMKEMYGRLGRLFARVEPLTRFDDTAPGVVDVIYEIDEDRLRELLGDESARDLDWLKRLQEELERAGYIRKNDKDKMELTPKGIRKIGEKALKDLFSKLREDRLGTHELPKHGILGEKNEEDTKPYEFGDPFNIHLSRTLKNGVFRRGAGTPVQLEPDDFEIYRDEKMTQASTVILLDQSRSMAISGKNSANTSPSNPMSTPSRTTPTPMSSASSAGSFPALCRATGRPRNSTGSTIPQR